MRIKEGLNLKRQLIFGLSDSREIVLTGMDDPKALNMIEDEAINLAKHLNVSLEKKRGGANLKGRRYHT